MEKDTIDEGNGIDPKDDGESLPEPTTVLEVKADSMRVNLGVLLTVS